MKLKIIDQEEGSKLYDLCCKIIEELYLDEILWVESISEYSKLMKESKYGMILFEELIDYEDIVFESEKLPTYEELKDIIMWLIWSWYGGGCMWNCTSCNIC